METDFIYERKKFPDGLKVEEISGGEDREGKVWRALAMQIYCENGRDDYRDVGHFDSGAPFLFNSDERISISHTDHLLVVATIKASPDSNLSIFDPEAFIGIDTERADRAKVMGLRKRFLSDEELKLVPDDLESTVVAWTCKEAMLKASLTPGIDWHHDLVIRRLPREDAPGEGLMRLPSGDYPCGLLTYRSGEYVVTVCMKG